LAEFAGSRTAARAAVDRDAGRGGAGAERHRAHVAGVDALVVADVGDAAVALAVEVLEGEADAAGVVGQHGVDVDAGGRAVEGDEGQPGVELGLQVAVVVGDRLDDDAVHAPARHRAHGVALEALVVLCGHRHDHEALRAGGGLDGAQHRVGLGDVAHGGADGAAAAAAQLPRPLVDLEAERVDRGPDAVGELGSDRVVAVDVARHRPQCDAGLAGHVGHRGAPLPGSDLIHAGVPSRCLPRAS
jgi:hypothetical protein